MAAVDRKTVSQAALLDDTKQLKLVEVFFFGSTAQVPFDFRAVPNITAASLCSQLHLQTHSTNRRMTMADGFKATVLGEVDNVPMTVGGMTRAFTVLVVNDALFSLVIKRPTMKNLRASLDLDLAKDISIFRSGEQVVTILL